MKCRPSRRMKDRGMTLVEIIVFGAIGIALVLTVIGFLTQGTRLLSIGRKTSGIQTALRILVGTLSEDAAELVHLVGDGKPWDSGTGGSFSFVISSNRTESGLTGSGTQRQITYSLEGEGVLKTIVRHVQVQGSAPSETRQELARNSISRIRIWPLSAFRNTATDPGAPRFLLVEARDPLAHRPGSTVVGIVVDIQAGEGVGSAEDAVERQPIAALVTKLWCRNRILELARGGLR